MQRSKFGSYLGYTDRDGSLLDQAAPDRKWRRGQALTDCRRRNAGANLLGDLRFRSTARRQINTDSFGGGIPAPEEICTAVRFWVDGGCAP